ncbi:permease prefix domain 1-containing protein [Actinomyces oris]|uniref:Permease prefix domain 1-containing protein n=1 Tax=Actinomyces oris TaxID=544580 RepID=A0AAW9KG27_9ACTO|nr:permease prefix domain 1-containing protein [Actinomyces oris]MEA1305303.1 permease prefix domain 1-containing protein [Actinomyces oris]
MDTIETFLDNMFAPYPTTPRLTEARAELRAMMEDAYNDAIAQGKTHNEAVGQVITDFGNLHELAPVLGIAADIRPDAEPQATPAAGTPTGPSRPAYPVVTLPEAQALAQAKRSTASTLAHAVSLFVCAPTALIVLTSLTEAGRLAISDNTASFLGIAFALLLVGLGVGMLVQRRTAFSSVHHLIEGKFTPNPVVTAWAVRERLNHETVRTRRLTIAVFLWIVSALPILATSMLAPDHGPQSELSSVGVAISLVIIATGLSIYLPAAWASSTYTTLTHPGGSGEYSSRRSDGEEDEDPFVGFVASIYWPAAVVIYLLWSFIFDAWDISWILWPVAAVAFAIFASVRSYRRDRQ